MPVVGVRHAYLVHSQHTVFCNLPYILTAISHSPSSLSMMMRLKVQDDTKKWELLKNPTKIEEIQKKKLLTEIEPLQLAF